MRLKTSRKNDKEIRLPVVIAKEGNWFVANVPMLDLATQGKTLKEVKDNLADLLDLYFENPHTPKPTLKSLTDVDVILTTITVDVPIGALSDAKTHSIAKN